MVIYIGVGKVLLKGLVEEMLLTFAGEISKFLVIIWFFTGDYGIKGLGKLGIVATFDEAFVMLEILEGRLVILVGMLVMLDGMLAIGTEGGMFWYIVTLGVIGFALNVGIPSTWYVFIGWRYSDMITLLSGYRGMKFEVCTVLE